MESGFRAASAWVEISTDLDGRQIESAARRAAERVDAELTEGISRTGSEISATLGRAGDQGGERMARGVESRLRDASGRFRAAGGKAGEDVGRGIDDGGKRDGGRSFLSWINNAGRSGELSGSAFTGSLIRASAPVIVAQAPLLGAALSGGIVAGLGVGTIGAGIALAMQNERVKAAATETGAFIGDTLKSAASPFREELIDTFSQARGAFARWSPELRGLFMDASKLMRPLTTGLENMADSILPGVRQAVQNAEEPVDSLRYAFERVGDATGDMFSTLAEDADEGAAAIDDLAMAAENFIRVSTGIVHGLAQVKGGLEDMDVAIDKGRFALEDYLNNGERFKTLGIQVDLTADGFKAGSKEAEAARQAVRGLATDSDFATLKLAGMTDAEIRGIDSSGRYRGELSNTAGSLEAVRGAANRAIPGVRSLTEIMDDYAGQTLDAERANMRLEAAIDDATQAAKDNKDKGINPNTKAGRENRAALLDIASASREASKKILAQTGSQEQASAATERGRKKFLEVASAMGVSSGKAQELANKLFGIPAERKPKITVQDAQAKAALEAIKHGIATVHSKTVTVTVKYETRGSVQGEHIIGQGTLTKRDGGITLHARDGILRDAGVFAPATFGGQRYAFAEPGTGGEAMTPRFARPGTEGQVLSTLATAAGWHGMEVRPKGASGGGGNHFHFGPGSIVLDASKIRNVADLADMVERLVPAARSMVRRGASVGSKA